MMTHEQRLLVRKLLKYATFSASAADVIRKLLEENEELHAGMDQTVALAKEAVRRLGKAQQQRDVSETLCIKLWSYGRDAFQSDADFETARKLVESMKQRQDG